MTTDLARIPVLDVLTPRQRAFVTNPLSLTDPEMAAVQSGYASDWSRKHAQSLKKELYYYIVAAGPAQHVRQQVSAQSVLDELNNLAFSDVTDFFDVIDSLDENGSATGSMLVPKQNIKAMPVHMRRLIKRIRFSHIVLQDGHTIVVVDDIELHNKDWALKEMIEILRLKQAGAPKDETSALLEQMDAKDLEEIENVFERSRRKLRKTIDKKKDQDAIEAE